MLRRADKVEKISSGLSRLKSFHAFNISRRIHPLEISLCDHRDVTEFMNDPLSCFLWKFLFTNKLFVSLVEMLLNCFQQEVLYKCHQPET